MHTWWEQVIGCPQKQLPFAGAGVLEVLDPGSSWYHLCHLDHVGELSEAGDGDDVMVGPTLGPGRRKKYR